MGELGIGLDVAHTVTVQRARHARGGAIAVIDLQLLARGANSRRLNCSGSRNLSCATKRLTEL